MDIWIILGIGLVVGLLLLFTGSAVFVRVVRFMNRSANARDLSGDRRGRAFVDIGRWKLAFALVWLFIVSVASWYAKYHVEQAEGDPLFIEIAAAIFQVSTAALLGGLVFQLFLRREILNEVSQTLAEIVMSRKEIIQSMFTRSKQNEIMEKILQVQLGSDVCGSALSSMVADLVERAESQNQFRFGFEDDIIVEPIVDSDVDPRIAEEYYKVTDSIYFRTRLSPRDEFITGYAGNEEQLYALFSDPSCVYRWFVRQAKATDFEQCVKLGWAFNPAMAIDGVECDVVSSGFTERGYEVVFRNPFTQASYEQIGARIGEVVEFSIRTETLVPRQGHVLAVYFAYPVRGARVQLSFGGTGIAEVMVLHVFSSKYHLPRISRSPGRVSVVMKDDDWLWPDSGVVFAW